MGKKKSLMQELKSFLKNLRKDIIVEKVILFGSRARKDFSEDSDVDLIIVSDDFEGKNFFERASMMYDYWHVGLPVDFLCYTNKEFNTLKKRISIVKEALREGVSLLN